MYNKFGQFIDGKWQPSSNKETYDVINPATEEIIGKARAEAQSIVSDGKKASEKVRGEIETKAKEKANTIVAQAEKQITAEKEQAISDIRGEVAALSIQIAEKLIRKNLSKKDNMALIKESLDKAGKVNEA